MSHRYTTDSDRSPEPPSPQNSRLVSWEIGIHCSVYSSWKSTKQFDGVARRVWLRYHIFILRALISTDLGTGKLGQSQEREMDVFKDPGSSHEQIHEAGLKIVAAHFSTDQNSVSENLNEVREIQFHKKCSSKSTKRGVNLASLVLSEDSVYLHLDRAYFQIQDWQGNALEPTDYGWEIKDGLLEPILMQQDPAPVCLVEVTQCKLRQQNVSVEGALAIASSVTCSIASGCQNCEIQDVEEEGSDGRSWGRCHLRDSDEHNNDEWFLREGFET